ncbi:CopG family ribbon-helix-helix protein [Methylomonas sp. OY6]|uniref:CopG family ribbon-helix-helix protein n=1 Tax=Methylomonas defluvii TaxID=3045149 RepID=A0ABU4UDA3_9GAMM|nr:CopG family ribbon-helix-helix protein [Methylomonas sp. OY6]MDX8127459.1 CopG family ribbon-helix-helix protein [Methylomonas sp. OY6]
MATSIKLDDGLKTRIQNLANLRSRSPHWIMREAITDYVNREEAKENFKQEALNSWKAYQETGQHLTGQEVGDWLSKWGTDQEAEIPKCHD